MSLKNFSSEELEAELAKRKKDKQRPKPLESPNFKNLIELVEKSIPEYLENGHVDDDFDHYVFEAAMEAIYGKNIWKWWNKQDW